jgi:hypothetical protein
VREEKSESGRREWRKEKEIRESESLKCGRM